MGIPFVLSEACTADSLQTKGDVQVYTCRQVAAVTYVPTKLVFLLRQQASELMLFVLKFTTQYTLSGDQDKSRRERKIPFSAVAVVAVGAHRC